MNGLLQPLLNEVLRLQLCSVVSSKLQLITLKAFSVELSMCGPARQRWHLQYVFLAFFVCMPVLLAHAKSAIGHSLACSSCPACFQAVCVA